MVRTMFNTVSGKRIAIWGFAFKKDTNDTRESSAITVCHALLEEHARLAIYDPKVPAKTIIHDLRQACTSDTDHLSSYHKKLIDENVTIVDSAEEAARQAHAIAVMTEWDELKTLDYQAIYDSMQRPAFLFDGRNLLDHDALSAKGFEIHAIGKAFHSK